MVRNSADIWGRVGANSGNTQDGGVYLWQLSLEVLEYKHLGNGDMSFNTELKSLPDVSA